ncbi:hypothetical protein BT63DRAFT_159802 [Microthyrium microscopicum]|uniref:Uncharacterized protein n=1 Tax=Microthyrium microscopicum TaxID=703497 RepID=A0A6A6UMR7_9PEZI|nr:hypothetical protein BT63DRAFT_159802 [Microthyrium microscopicum]
MKPNAMMAKDGADMKEIASISKKIVVNTAKDSFSLRRIADVTMLFFLPPTFVAVWLSFCVCQHVLTILIDLISFAFFNFALKDMWSRRPGSVIMLSPRSC